MGSRVSGVIWTRFLKSLHSPGGKKLDSTVVQPSDMFSFIRDFQGKCVSGLPRLQTNKSCGFSSVLSALECHKAGPGPNTQQIQGLLKLLQSKSKPTPDSSFSVDTGWVEHVLHIGFSFPRVGIVSTLRTLFIRAQFERPGCFPTQYSSTTEYQACVSTARARWIG